MSPRPCSADAGAGKEEVPWPFELSARAEPATTPTGKKAIIEPALQPSASLQGTAGDARCLRQLQAELDFDIASEDSRVRVFVNGAREDLVAARVARELLGGQGRPC